VQAQNDWAMATAESKASYQKSIDAKKLAVVAARKAVLDAARGYITNAANLVAVDSSNNASALSDLQKSVKTAGTDFTKARNAELSAEKTSKLAKSSLDSASSASAEELAKAQKAYTEAEAAYQTAKAASSLAQSKLNTLEQNLMALAIEDKTTVAGYNRQWFIDSKNALMNVLFAPDKNSTDGGKDINGVSYQMKAEKDKVQSFIGQAATTESGVIATRQKAEDVYKLGTTDLEMNQLAQQTTNNLASVKTNQFQAKNTRSSHIAGNPVSTMNMTVDSMFNQVADFGGNNNTTQNLASASSDGGIKTSVGVGLQYGYYDLGNSELGNKSANTVSMPLSLTAQFNPKHQLTLSVPLSYIAIQNQSDAYQVGVGLAYKYSLNDNWSLTPAINYAYRSMDNTQNEYLDTRSSTELVGGSITSKYTWNLQSNALKLSLINMIGHFQSLDANNNATKAVDFGAISGLDNQGQLIGTAANSTIANYVIKNGIHATKNMGNFDVGAYFTDTEYFGSALYFDQFNEIGFSMKPQNMGSYLNALSVDANYLFSIGGKHSSQLDGFRLNLNYKY
jgi:hypothetical protein